MKSKHKNVKHNKKVLEDGKCLNKNWLPKQNAPSDESDRLYSTQELLRMPLMGFHAGFHALAALPHMTAYTAATLLASTRVRFTVYPFTPSAKIIFIVSPAPGARSTGSSITGTAINAANKGARTAE